MGCPQFYYKQKTSITEFLEKVHGSFYIHMSCKKLSPVIHTFCIRAHTRNAFDL